MIDWTEDALRLKSSSILPPKVSLKPNKGEFFNFMPCIIPSLNIAGIKVVSRHTDTFPTIKSAMMLFDLSSGECLSVMDADFITMARTGIMAALSAKYLGKKEINKIALIGLGNTARSTIDAISSLFEGTLNISILAYKNQEKSFIERFEAYDNIKFTIVYSISELFSDADIIFSCISYTDENLCEATIYKPGVLIIPVHTRGFQNCDDFFDLVVADDIPHISGFGKFNKMNRVIELGDVISGKTIGRRSESDRILAYNIGIGLLDVYFGAKLMQSMQGRIVDFNTPVQKFWW